MNHRSFVRCIFFCVPLLLACQNANAWFFFWFPLPGSSSKDPDSIVVSAKDRLVGKCAGYHTNQRRLPSAEQQSFHEATLDKIILMAEDKEKVQELAGIFDGRWGQAVKVDVKTNRAYGADLASACRNIGIPVTFAEQEAIKRQEEARRQEEANRQEEAKRQEEIKRQEAAKPIVVEEKPSSSLALQSTTSTIIDFNSEARKSARILGCITSDLKVVGAEEKNVLFLASCESGTSLTLSCDPAGLCLKK